MKRYPALFLIFMLAGCGAEVATTASTGAAAKAREVEEARKTTEQYQQKLDAAQQAQLQGIDQAEKEAAEK